MVIYYTIHRQEIGVDPDQGRINKGNTMITRKIICCMRMSNKVLASVAISVLGWAMITPCFSAEAAPELESRLDDELRDLD